MLFTSPTFIFAFLPLVLIFYHLSPKKLKNNCLLIFSLLFYAWGEVTYVLLMIASIVVNALIGRLIHQPHDRNKAILTLGIVLNLLPLVFFKYYVFLLNQMGWQTESNIHLPLGISFFTFQAISYLVDVYRKETDCERSLINLGLYIALFPQLIAGPIVRFKTIHRQITERIHSSTLFVSGIERFVFGLSKKLLIANPLGYVADQLFDLPADQLSGSLAWLGIISYSLQIYFDFSAYSDMAIGLGRMFGFKILENFNYPYISQSIQEFWRRWHISMSQWFRDYLYIPLGGNRKSPGRIYFNLIVVFTLCGLWHGASWSFVVWGLYHGLFLVIERLGLAQWLQQTFKPLRHLYVLLVVTFGWVFFRAENLTDALAFQAKMLTFSTPDTVINGYPYFISPQYILALIFAIILSTSVAKKFSLADLAPMTVKQQIPRQLWVLLLMLLNFTVISASTYNPFIYFRF
ncbi:MBOAT family O-acyltransferase [Marinicella litoralis]|uniref:Probable alginate O-acetylase n=1 Tax=Marinicella litoralis TaxID=644220 RepID=A0A4R6XRK2_9GAMM|nr:MBOAT family O-acyltransferase [Marinicella litoralis]TDR22525.1 alginate O-acetyltransferase complex protein AlgI [Marinicella litoralis]